MFLLEHPAGDPSAHTKRVAGDGSRRGRGAGTLVGLCEEVRGLEGCRQGPVLGICDSLPPDLTIVKSPVLLENDPAFFFFLPLRPFVNSDVFLPTPSLKCFSPL